MAQSPALWWTLGGLAVAWALRPTAGRAAAPPGHATGPLTFDALAPEYRARYTRAVILPARRATVESLARNMETATHRARYHAVADPLGVPWYVVAIIHNLESSARWNAHLHNGDPLTARTTHVPVGRPTTGSPPFTWEESATDALRGHALDRWRDWSVAGICYQLERFNGTGYRAHDTPTPYLWSFTDQYQRGKFVADGVFSPTAVSAQCGACALLKELVALGAIDAPPL